MEPTSQVVLRNLDALPDGRLLLVNPPPDGLHASLANDTRTVMASTQDRGDYRYLAAAGADARFEAFPPADPSLAAIIMTLPREKARTDADLQTSPGSVGEVRN